MQKTRTWTLGSYTAPPVIQTSVQQNATFQMLPAVSYSFYGGEDSKIVYETGNDARMRSCEHYARRARLIGGSTESQIQEDIYNPLSTRIRTGEEAQCFARSASVAFNNAMNLDPLNSINFDWNAASAQAVATMMPSMTSSLNFVNAVIELKDFKKLGEKLAAKASKLSILQEAVGYKPGKGKVRNASSSYLAYMFAWKPLFNDAVSLYTQLLNWRKRFNELMRRANTPQQRYYGFNVSTTISTNRNIISGSWSAGTRNTFDGGCDFVVQEYDAQPPRYNATMRFRYTIPPGLKRLDAEAWGFLDALGVNVNPATLWNAVPFTFIVDWIVNVGSYLQRLRVDNLDFRSSTEILDFCHSIKGRRKYKVRIRCNNRNGIGVYYPSPYRDYATGEKTYYKRMRAIPNMFAALSTSGLSPTEMLLGGALGGSRYKR